LLTTATRPRDHEVEDLFLTRYCWFGLRNRLLSAGRRSIGTSGRPASKTPSRPVPAMVATDTFGRAFVVAPHAITSWPRSRSGRRPTMRRAAGPEMETVMAFPRTRTRALKSIVDRGFGC